MTVSSSRPCFHGSQASHTSILLVELTADLQNFPRGFFTACQQIATNDSVSQGQGFDNVPGFGDSTIGQDGDAQLLGGSTGDVERRHLRNTYPGDHARRADTPRALTNLDTIGTAFGQVGNSTPRSDIAGDDRQVLKGIANHANRLPHPTGMTMSRGNSDRVHSSLHQCFHMVQGFFAVQLTR